MKKLLTLLLALVSALSLAAVAHADVISPAGLAVALIADNIVWILVAAVVIVTAVILWKLRKR